MECLVVARFRLLSLVVIVSLLSAAVCFSADVLTNNYDSLRSGANRNETILDTANVATQTFGRTHHFAVDGPVYAQPLIVGKLALTNGAREVVFIATANNSVYAFDSAGGDYALLWQRKLVKAPDGKILPATGILSTPVIDRDRSVIYVVAALLENGAQQFILHALKLTDGRDQHEPVVIRGAVKVGTTDIAFQPTTTRIAVQRAALAIAKDKLIVAFGGDYFEGWIFAFDRNHLDAAPAAFCTTCASRDAAISNVDYLDTNCVALGPGGGIWQSGRGPVVDAQGKVYFFSGNKQHVVKAGCKIPRSDNACVACSDDGGCLCKPSRFSDVCRGADVCRANESEDRRYFDVNEALIQLDPNQALKLTGWFRPTNWNIEGSEGLEINDLDLGGSGPLLIPGTNTVIGGGKQGILYALDTTLKQPSCVAKLAETCIAAKPIQSFQVAPPPPRPNQYYRYILGGPVLWMRPLAQGGARAYVWRQNDHLRSYPVSDRFDGCSTDNPAPTASHVCPSLAQSEDFIDHQPGGILAISANGAEAKSAIVWATTTRALNGPGKLMAFKALPDANGQLEKIWDSDRCVEDRLDLGSDFVPPTVANGKVLVATNANRVDVFGLMPNKTCTGEPLPKSIGPMMQ
jgi:hypothetical protein